MRRHAPAAVGLFAVLAAVLVPLGAPAGAETGVERLRREQREVQERRAARAAEIDVLQADDDEIGRALDALEAHRRGRAAALAAARQRSAAEAARAAEAEAAEQRTRARLQELKATVRRMAVDEYIRGGAPELDVTLDLTAPMETARRRSLLNASMDRTTDAADQLREAQEDLAVERAAAERAAEAAATEQRRVEDELAELESATREQQALAADVERRLEGALAEAASLATLDSSIADRIRSEQAALARRLRATRPSTRRVDAPTRSRVTGPGSLTSVRGIVVATSIAGNLADLLDAADAAGVPMGGGGYRDSSQQIATRRNNCGPSDYDIYEKPASECHPPTARPGHSMHEQGLAVDFTHDGRILTRSSPAFRWLQANADRYGFYNLPSEPWHWSTNGN